MKVNDLRDYRVPVVNGLLQRAFGSRFAGNFGDSEFVPLPEIHELGFIVNRRFLGYHKVIGKFDCQDGSSIRVLPKYASSAVLYAEMYEAKFGKKATVNIDSVANGDGLFFS